jgi:hypothetical protein
MILKSVFTCIVILGTTMFGSAGAEASTMQFDFSFATIDAGFFDASGVLTVTGTPGDYTVIDASGTSNLAGEFPFTILSGGGNLFYPNSPYLDNSGISFLVRQINSEFVQDIYFENGYAVRLGNNEIPGTFTISAVTPLPATLPLFAGGLCFVGYLTGRRKRASAATA